MPGSGTQKITATDNLCDMHRGIVYGARQLIARYAITAHDDEVAEVSSGGEGLRAEKVVVKVDRLSVVDAEAPCCFACA